MANLEEEIVAAEDGPSIIDKELTADTKATPEKPILPPDGQSDNVQG